jgi:formyltetrahydrofolate deformylase
LKTHAARHELDFHQISWDRRDQAEKKALKLMERYDVDFIVLARFMKILSPSFVWRWKNRIINIHPPCYRLFPEHPPTGRHTKKGSRLSG